MQDTKIQSAIGEDAQNLIAELSKQSESIGIFTIKGANKWLVDGSRRQVPEALFLCLWYQGEVCILFADTNLGKSILAVQIAVLIAAKYKVIYFDFELSDKQFENRYSENYADHFNFPDNFFRAEINTDEADYQSHGFNSVEDYLGASMESAIIDTGATVIIIDNLTYLKTETEKSRDALPLMKQLKALKNKHGLSILCLAHTPKRNLSLPITRNDLSGSKMLINFCDSAFAIGESTQDKNARYIKQIKARNTEIIYDSENVAMYQIIKTDSFLQFEHIGYSSERQHLKQLTEQDKETLKDKVVQRRDAGISYREIGKELSISHMMAKRIYDECNKV